MHRKQGENESTCQTVLKHWYVKQNVLARCFSIILEQFNYSSERKNLKKADGGQRTEHRSESIERLLLFSANFELSAKLLHETSKNFKNKRHVIIIVIL